MIQALFTWVFQMQARDQLRFLPLHRASPEERPYRTGELRFGHRLGSR
jgi:hypothetical protein